MNDAANADRLLTMHGDELLYCPPMKSWYKFDGRIWRRDVNNSMLQLARDVADSYRTEARKLDDDNPMKSKLLKWASVSSNLFRMRSMVEIAQSNPDICVDIAVLDRNPLLLAVENGVLELDTGTFRTFDRHDYITQIAPVQYTRGAKCREWDKFLGTVMPDPETRHYLQCAVGYSLTASTCEGKMFILHGDGANGKTTFINTILALMGGYASQASSQTLIRKRNSGPNDDLFSLMGKRFVAATETGENHQLDESLVKQMTGGNRISVNPKYRTQMEFLPSWKLWLDTNYEPNITGTDNGIWRRMVKVPFQVTIKKDDVDTGLMRRLMNDRAERSGILNWALQGAREWHRNGLNESALIQTATSRYRSDQDTIGMFIEERCVRRDDVSVPKSELYLSYVSFCHEVGSKPRSMNAVGRQLKTLGIGESRSSVDRYWIGIDNDRSVELYPVHKTQHR